MVLVEFKGGYSQTYSKEYFQRVVITMLKKLIFTFHWIKEN